MLVNVLPPSLLFEHFTDKYKLYSHNQKVQLCAKLAITIQPETFSSQGELDLYCLIHAICIHLLPWISEADPLVPLEMPACEGKGVDSVIPSNYRLTSHHGDVGSNFAL